MSVEMEGASMDIILVPGLWLDASSWDLVAGRLRAAGHRTTALTLRGLESRANNRQGIMLADHVAEIVSAIDRCGGPVVLVGHAESGGLIHAAVNRRPESVARAVYVGGLPSADGAGVLSGFTADSGGRLTHTGGLRTIDPSLAAMHQRMTENAAHVLDGMQRLTDDRRYDVPVTVIATEFTAEDVRRWMVAGVDPARELERISDVTLVDLRSPRCTQLVRGDDLADVLLGAIPPVDSGGGMDQTGAGPRIPMGSMLRTSAKH
jgi:pimeloyl-ACP methyl ester carboxylesterase